MDCCGVEGQLYEGIVAMELTVTGYDGQRWDGSEVGDDTVCHDCGFLLANPGEICELCVPRVGANGCLNPKCPGYAQERD